MDELINIPTKAEERYMIQISFSTQDLNIRTDKQNPEFESAPKIRESPRFAAKVRNMRSFQGQIRRSKNLSTSCSGTVLSHVISPYVFLLVEAAWSSG